MIDGAVFGPELEFIEGPPAPGPATDEGVEMPHHPGAGWHLAAADEDYPINKQEGADWHGTYTSQWINRTGRCMGLYTRPQLAALHTPADDDLQIYDPEHPSRHEINLTLVRLADPGICAEVLRFQQSLRLKRDMQQHTRELDQQWNDWHQHSHGIDQQLCTTNMPMRLTEHLPTGLTPPLLEAENLNPGAHAGRLNPHINLSNMPPLIAIERLAPAEPAPVPVPPPTTPQPIAQPQCTPRGALGMVRLHNGDVRPPLLQCYYCNARDHLSFECRTPHHVVKSRKTTHTATCTVNGTIPRQRLTLSTKRGPTTSPTTSCTRHQCAILASPNPRHWWSGFTVRESPGRYGPAKTTRLIGTSTKMLMNKVVRDEQAKKGAYVMIM
ncbi:hypothetical protein EDB83DRAFT_2318593 [Lactarius deliciosus]|nr:hypothetical protein EDB83DRAFT_2318593 [Lactarius deliciosus]